MKGHGPFTITLADGQSVFSSSSTEDTFEVNGAIITVMIAGRGKAEDEYHVIKLWQKLNVAVDNVG